MGGEARASSIRRANDAHPDDTALPTPDAAPVTVDDAGFIDTSFPGFSALLNRLAAGEAITPP